MTDTFAGGIFEYILLMKISAFHNLNQVWPGSHIRICDDIHSIAEFAFINSSQFSD